jgi:hypothetical protein
VETLLRRAKACGAGTKHVMSAILGYYGSYRFEKVHPLQCGIVRRKVRNTRRPGLPRENPLLFYPRRLWELCSTYSALAGYHLWLERIRRRVENDPHALTYTDAALARPAIAAAAAA